MIELTGLRNPCAQIDNFQPGLLSAVLGRDEQGNLIRKASVLRGGEVRAGDRIRVEFPSQPFRPLERV